MWRVVFVAFLLAHGPGPPYESAVAMTQRIPDARLVTVASGGHMMLGAHPGELGEVASFIKQHEPSPAGASVRAS